MDDAGSSDADRSNTYRKLNTFYYGSMSIVGVEPK